MSDAVFKCLVGLALLTGAGCVLVAGCAPAPESQATSGSALEDTCPYEEPGDDEVLDAEDAGAVDEVDAAASEVDAGEASADAGIVIPPDAGPIAHDAGPFFAPDAAVIADLEPAVPYTDGGGGLRPADRPRPPPKPPQPCPTPRPRRDGGAGPGPGRDAGAPRPDAGSDLPNGKPCTADRQCSSGFCSQRQGNVCAACEGCHTTSLHGQDVVKECVAQSGEHKCSSAKHFPCAGTHDNVQYERCIAGPTPVIRRGTGVRCQGGAPAVAAMCDATMTTSCGTGGTETTGVHDNAKKICD